MSATIQTYPSQVREDATSLLVFIGPAHRSVDWSLSGAGSLTVITGYTDGQGRAYARYTPGTAGDSPTITAAYGT